MSTWRLKATPSAEGTSTLHIGAKAHALYTAPSGIDVSMAVEDLNKPLKDCTPAQIQAIIAAGDHKNIWSIGDQIPLVWNGGVDSDYLLYFNKETYYCRIIDMDHNKDISTSGKNNVLFKAPYSQQGRQGVFVDDGYMSPDPLYGTAMTVDGIGGWKDSNADKVIMDGFYMAMPSDMRNVIALATIYSDNVGQGAGSIAADVTATQNKIFYLAEKEVYGKIECGNTYEGNYQQQVAAYKNGLSKVHYNYSWLDNASKYSNYPENVWLRSHSATTTSRFVVIGSNGIVSTQFGGYDSYAGPSPVWYIAA